MLVVTFATVASGGAEGQMLGAFNPSEWSASPAVGIGFFLAFWSWIGFETTAIYGEETTDPKRSVPRATYIAVLTLGIFYTFVAYAGTVGLRQRHACPGRHSARPALLRAGRRAHVRLRPHRDGLPRRQRLLRLLVRLPQQRVALLLLARPRRHPSRRPGPYASTSTSRRTWRPASRPAIAIATIAIFAVGGADPILHLGTWLPIFCTLAVILVQLIVSVAVVGYFNKVGRESPGRRPEDAGGAGPRRRGPGRCHLSAAPQPDLPGGLREHGRAAHPAVRCGHRSCRLPVCAVPQEQAVRRRTSPSASSTTKSSRSSSLTRSTSMMVDTLAD